MQLKVYYIDDEKDLCLAFEDDFSSEEIGVSTFSQFEKGIEAIKSNPPDLVFLDYRFKNATADQIVDQIPSEIPVVLITGEYGVSRGQRYLKVFQKPYRYGEVRRFILAFGEERKSKKQAA